MKKYICLALSFSLLTAAVDLVTPPTGVTTLSEVATPPRPFKVTYTNQNTTENLPPPTLNFHLSEEDDDTQFIAPLPLANRGTNTPPPLKYKEGMKEQRLSHLSPLPPPIPFELPRAVLNFSLKKRVFTVTNTKTNKSEEFARLSAIRPPFAERIIGMTTAEARCEFHIPRVDPISENTKARNLLIMHMEITAPILPGISTSNLSPEENEKREIEFHFSPFARDKLRLTQNRNNLLRMITGIKGEIHKKESLLNHILLEIQLCDSDAESNWYNKNCDETLEYLRKADLDLIECNKALDNVKKQLVEIKQKCRFSVL